MHSMKHLLVIASLILAVLGLAGAQASVSTLRAKDPRSMGIGGSFSATSWGYDGLYGNPAAAASSKPQFMIADFSAWAYLKPTQANIDKALALVGGNATPADMAATANDLIVGNGFGGGFSTGLGYVGKGLALGMYAIGDAVAEGDSALGAKVTSSASINLVVGLGFPISLGDKATLRLGGDMRPFFRADSVDGGWLFSDFLTAFAGGGSIESVVNGELVDGGFGLAMDLGAQLQMGNLSLGLAVRDLSPSFVTSQETVSQLLANLSAGTIPDLSTGYSEVMLPAVYLGLAWKPRLIPGFLEPGLYLELQDPVAIVMDKASIWNLVHAGLDLRLFSFLTLQAGFNKGWLSAGAGVNLYLIELNAAVFTEEFGLHPGDSPRSGLSFQVSIHL